MAAPDLLSLWAA